MKYVLFFVSFENLPILSKFMIDLLVKVDQEYGGKRQTYFSPSAVAAVRSENSAFTLDIPGGNKHTHARPWPSNFGCSKNGASRELPRSSKVICMATTVSDDIWINISAFLRVK
jgi:hypothetical protein